VRGLSQRAGKPATKRNEQNEEKASVASAGA